MSGQPLDFVHEFKPASADVPVTLLLLHGTGGDEHSLLQIGNALLPGAALLSPRGKVSEHGAPRFFRRLSEGVFDLPDLHARTAELADFITAAARHYKFDASKLVAVGYSNGANIAGSMLLSRPEVVAGAVLLRPMVPFVPKVLPNLSGKSVLILAGKIDPIATLAETQALADLLRKTGADIEINTLAAGHGLMQEDLQAAAQWLSRFKRA